MTHEELFEAYVADTLDEEATAELEKLLAEDAEFASRFAEDLLATGLFVEEGGELVRVADQAEHATPPPPPPEAGAHRPSGATPPPPPKVALEPAAHHAPSDPGQVYAAPVGAAPAPQQQPVLASARPRSPIVPIVIVLLLLGVVGAVIVGLNREPPAPPVTIPVLAKVDVGMGLMVTRENVRQSAPNGFDLHSGDLLVAEEGVSRIAFANERTFLQLNQGCEVALDSSEEGKALRLNLGELVVEVGSQPVGRPFVVLTDNARVTVRGAKLSVRTAGRETFVEVVEGSATVERKLDGAKVDLAGGTYANVLPEGPLTAWQFVAGINLGGEEAQLAGRSWLSQSAAVAQGMEVKALDKELATVRASHEPLGGPEPALRSVLTTAVRAEQTRLSLNWPVANGSYQVLLWIMEDEGDQARSLRVNLEQKLVGSDLAADLPVGGWSRSGPFGAIVEDGSLDLLLTADHQRPTRDPVLAGLAIYRAAGAAVPVEPAEEAAPAPEPDPGS